MLITITNTHSKEMVKPSSPTPQSLRRLQLSFLDQLAPPIYIHIILYYKPRAPAHRRHLIDGVQETSENLKRSLSEALTLYYPLAGRLQDGDTWVQCDDSGAEYLEALFEGLKISDIIENPDIEELRKFVPPCAGPGVPLAVQANFFGCGGIAIGVCVSHRVADATSMVDFANAWAEISSSGNGYGVDLTTARRPRFDLSERFLPANFSKYFPEVAAAHDDHDNQMPNSLPKVVAKRFVFEEKMIDLMRKMASGPTIKKPTRVEAVSAFIWRHLIHAKDEDAQKPTVYAASYAVDIRARANPPLPEHIFGNACARAMAMTTTATLKESSGRYYELVVNLRDAIKKADAGYSKRLEDGDAFLEYYSKSEENEACFRDGSKALEMCFFTSWCRLRAYEADFGWGRPDWASIVGVPVKNLVFFLGTKGGDGIEAWLNLAKEDAEVVEDAFRLLTQASGQ